ncbi:diacylglycerol/lipid kinase family protein [Spirosoma gilvum]
MRTLLLLNEVANNGTAVRKWASVEKEVLARLPTKPTVMRYRPGFDLGAWLQSALTTPEPTAIIAAGGDGTLHYVLNTLMNLPADSLTSVYLGSIGLGSSNDFHKPVRHHIRGIPIRLDATRPIWADVGRVRYTQPDGQPQTRYFLINASLGITAQANYLFNEGDWFIKSMKNRWVGLAIQYTALKTIFSYRARTLTLRVDDASPLPVRLTNLNLLKIPYVSGSFHYRQDIRPDDGQFGLNYCYELSLPETLRLMMDMQQGRFAGIPKRVAIFARTMQVDADDFLPFEMDGEVVLTRHCTIDLLPGAIQVLT